MINISPRKDGTSLKINQTGYVTEDGAIYLGFYGNTPEEYVYAMPVDIEGDRQTIQTALQWIENANDTMAYNHNDWDLPYGPGTGKNELYLMSCAAQYFNKAFHFKRNYWQRYGSKTIDSYTEGGHICYEGADFWDFASYHSYNERDKVNFRAVRRTKHLII